MADFHEDRPETINHPDILKFLSVCNDVCGDGIVSFAEFQQGPLLSFWSNSIILRWEEEKHDFLYVFWGTELTKVYGLELSGKYIADGDHKDTENPFIITHLESMNEKKKIYLGGTIDWRDKGFQNWNQVIQPLSRNGHVGETLTYVTFQ